MEDIIDNTNNNVVVSPASNTIVVDKYERLKAVGFAIIVITVVVCGGLFGYNQLIKFQHSVELIQTPCDLCCQYNPTYNCNQIKNTNPLLESSELLKNYSAG